MDFERLIMKAAIKSKKHYPYSAVRVVSNYEAEKNKWKSSSCLTIKKTCMS